MKTSLNIAMATSTEKHNDRSLYEKESPSEFMTEGHAPNEHWDCYGYGSSYRAEKVFYEREFGRELVRQNRMNEEQRHYENVMSMDEYHKKHMPREMIFQLGNKDEQPMNDEWVKQMCRETVAILQSYGVKVISYDVHNDEATPHAHMRFVGIDSHGKNNLTGCLEEHGMKRPLQIACEHAGVTTDREGNQLNYKTMNPLKDLTAEDLQAVKKQAPELFYTKKDGTDGFRTRSNTVLNTLTNDVLRDHMEERAVEMGYDIDTVRQNKRHLTVEAYKAQQDRVQADEECKGLIQIAKEEQQKAQQRSERSYNAFKQQIQGIMQTAAGRPEKADPLRDSEGEIINQAWFEREKQAIRDSSFKQSKKDRLERLYDEAEDYFRNFSTKVQEIIDEPEQNIDLNGLEQMQAAYDAEQERQREIARQQAMEAQRRAEAQKRAEEQKRAQRRARNQHSWDDITR